MTQPMQDSFQRMFDASRAAPVVPWAVRADRLDRLGAVLADGRAMFARAIAEDFGRRPQAETDLAEVFPLKSLLREAQAHGRGWMRPRRVGVGRWLWPARARIEPHPLGVIGILAPWNYPLMLTIGPLIAALAAGNRAMIKPSEQAPGFAEALTSALAARFDPAEVTCITGGADVAADFCALDFDHLIFTGGTEIGRKAMTAAAANLTPVTLELGGKSPALIAPDARLDHAAARIMAGKMLNAGQTCIAPDYVLVPRDRLDAFLDAARAWVAAHYPHIDDSRDYAAIINARHYDRLTGWLAAAEGAGAALYPLSDGQPRAGDRHLPPVAVTGAPDDSALMQNEIFGPILPVIPYDCLRDAVAHITARPRPLAFYPFTDDAETRAILLASVTAGGVCVNDTLMQAATPGLPFGGVGASGTGAWHGRAGFERLSHMQPVFDQARLSGAGWLAPPYGWVFRRLIGLMTR